MLTKKEEAIVRSIQGDIGFAKRPYQWVAQQTGRPLRLWPGSCYAHVQFTVRALEKVRAKFPHAPVVAHPECVQAVRDLADEERRDAGE